MPQQPIDHPPLQTADLPFTEQVLIRLDEIIGLLDQIAQRLQDGTPSTVREAVELSPAELLGEEDLVNLLAALAVMGMETPDAPRHAQITPRLSPPVPH